MPYARVTINFELSRARAKQFKEAPWLGRLDILSDVLDAGWNSDGHNITFESVEVNMDDNINNGAAPNSGTPGEDITFILND